MRQFAYDARHRLVSQTAKRNFVTGYDYGFHGRHTQANRADGTTRKLAPSQVVGLIDPASRSAGAPEEFVATFNRLPAGTEEVWFYLHGRLMGDPVLRSARSWFFHSR